MIAQLLINLTKLSGGKNLYFNYFNNNLIKIIL
jgi:hypothetical protein